MNNIIFKINAIHNSFVRSICFLGGYIIQKIIYPVLFTQKLFHFISFIHQQPNVEYYFLFLYYFVFMNGWCYFFGYCNSLCVAFAIPSPSITVTVHSILYMPNTIMMRNVMRVISSCISMFEYFKNLLKSYKFQFSLTRD